jgi:hypothetical protein
VVTTTFRLLGELHLPGIPSPRIPSDRLHKPTHLAVVRLNGRDFSLGQHGTPESQAGYRRLISEWLGQLDSRLTDLHAKRPHQIPPEAVDELVAWFRDGYAAQQTSCCDLLEALTGPEHLFPLPLHGSDFPAENRQLKAILMGRRSAQAKSRQDPEDFLLMMRRLAITPLEPAADVWRRWRINYPELAAETEAEPTADPAVGRGAPCKRSS